MSLSGSGAYLSVIATCSNMADPVLLFQFPEMDVRLEKHRTLCVKQNLNIFCPTDNVEKVEGYVARAP